jgi:hypothetical protein
MSEGCARLELTKGNEMTKDEINQMGVRELTEFVSAKTELAEIGAFSYALTLVWSLADSKTRERVVRLIEENN